MEDSAKLHEASRRLVAENVLVCVSGLVYGLTQHIGELSRECQEAIGFDEDDALELWHRAPDVDEYRENAPEGYSVREDEERGWIWEFTDSAGEILSDGDSYDDDEESAWRAAYDDAGEDLPDGAEIYEHWAITDWFAGKLEERGETVRRDILGGLTVWARPTTGQAIAIDHVVETIAREFYLQREP